MPLPLSPRHLLLPGLLALCTQLGGCFTVAHAVLSPVLDAGIRGAVEANATPESMGVSTAQYRGFDCNHLAALKPGLAAERDNPAQESLTRKAMGWHVDALEQVQRDQGCTAPGGAAATTATTASPGTGGTTPFYFYCYATDVDPNVRKTVASTVFEQPIPAMDPMARFNFMKAAEAEFKRDVMPGHGVPGAQPTCAAEDSLPKANASRARYRDLFSGFNLRFVDLAWRPKAQAAASAGPAPASPAVLAPGYLGVRIGAVDATMAQALGLPAARGAMVIELDAAAPATPGKAPMLKPLDVVLEIAGQPVQQPADLQGIVRRMRPGFQAPMRVWRDRAEIDLSATIGSAPASATATATATAAPARPAQAQAQAQPPAGPPRFCHGVLAPVGKEGGVQSAVWELPGPGYGHPAMLQALAGFVAHARQAQPGVWHDIPAGQCFPGSNHCTATALRHFGTSHQINQFCHATREQAEAARGRLAAGHAYTTLDWAPPAP